MEFIGIVALLLVLSVLGTPEKLKVLERKLHNIELKEKGGENIMSKILSEFKNKKCKLTVSPVPTELIQKVYECTILDLDERWIKISVTNKKEITTIHLLRIDSIEQVDYIEE